MAKTAENKEVKKSKFAIVNMAMRLLKLDDQGIVEKFYEKEVKRFKANIKVLKANIAQKTLTFEANKEQLIGQIEDAQDNLENAKLAINPEAIRSNEGIEAFREQYWSEIDYRKAELKKLEKGLEDLTDKFEDDVKEIEVEIDDTESCITMITDMK